jgi:hypothetical protein
MSDYTVAEKESLSQKTKALKQSASVKNLNATRVYLPPDQTTVKKQEGKLPA